MKVKQIKKDLEQFKKRYAELYQFVCVEHSGDTGGYGYLGEMDYLYKEIEHLERFLRYL